MLFSLKMIIALAMILAGAGAILIGNKQWRFAIRMIFGKEKLKKRGTKTLGFYLYLIGGALILVGLLVIF